MARDEGGDGSGAGRKPKPPAEKMRNRVGLAFTDSELRELRKRARGEPLATYIRRLVLRHLSRSRK